MYSLHWCLLVRMGSAVAYTKHNFEAGYKACMRDKGCILVKVKSRPLLHFIQYPVISPDLFRRFPVRSGSINSNPTSSSNTGAVPNLRTRNPWLVYSELNLCWHDIRRSSWMTVSFHWHESRTRLRLNFHQPVGSMSERNNDHPNISAQTRNADTYVSASMDGGQCTS